MRRMREAMGGGLGVSLGVKDDEMDTRVMCRIGAAAARARRQRVLRLVVLLLAMSAVGCEREISREMDAKAVYTSHAVVVNEQGDTYGQNTFDEKEMMKMVTLRVYGADGRLGEPAEQARLVLSVEEWKARLTPEQFRILRHHGTEAAFCGGLLHNKEKGVYVCAGCSLPLFETQAKFDSGTGWPSFFQPVAKENVLEVRDTSYGMIRVEIRCARCDGHLGHVFEDGPRPTGLRYCMNSEALRFVAQDKLGTLAENGG